MPRFAANLSLLFTEHALPERFAAAAAAGFSDVEIQFPYDYPAAQLRAAADAAGVHIILINLPAGDLMTGGYGLASHPARQNDFLAALTLGTHYATTLGVRMVNVLAGRFDPACDDKTTLRTLTTNLTLAAEHLAAHGIRTTCEAINNIDMPGFVITTPEQLATLLTNVAHHNVFMQLDLYHLARMQIDIPDAISCHLPKIGHIQFADHPGRHEPGTGQLPLPQIFDLLDYLDYNGWCSAEYHPQKTSIDSLRWLKNAK